MKFLDKIRKIDPYIPGEQPKGTDFIKLNANENPYPPSPSVQDVIKNFNYQKLSAYPDSNGTVLKSALADYYSLKPENVFLGNGSDDVLALAFQAFFCSEKPILYPDITYSFYPVWCDLFSIPYKNIPLREDFTIDVSEYKECGGVVIPNPNAPTSVALPLSEVEKLVEQNDDCVVIIDEAYVDFGAESAVSLINKYENLLVVQTMSKSRSLAGLRVGYALGSETLISVLEAVKNSYNSYTTNTLSMEIAAASVKDDSYFEEICKNVIKTRSRTAISLDALGFTVLPSNTNFLFATHKNMPAEKIFQELKERKIYIRYFNLPRISNYLRITIGTDKQMDALISALEEIVGQ